MTTNAENGQSRPAPDFPWMRVPTERGMKPAIGPQGLLLGDVDVNSYGDVPDVWPYKSDMPRGAYPPPPHLALTGSYSIFEKVEVWSDNVRTLYEDAIRDRWTSAADVPWDTLSENPEHIERAICQVCTSLSEQGYLTAQVISSWFEKIAYGFHEVKNFLATQVYDAARQHEAFRKRALANGGGLGIEGPGIFNRVIATSMTFTELVINLHLIRGTQTLVTLEALRRRAQTEADRALLSLTIRDIKRHMAYGVGHIAYYLSRQPRMLDQVHNWLNRAEMFLVADQRKDTPVNEALIILLGDTAAEGRAALEEMRRTFVAYYLNRLADGRVVDRGARLTAELARFAPENRATPTTVLLRPTVEDPTI